MTAKRLTAEQVQDLRRQADYYQYLNVTSAHALIDHIEALEAELGPLRDNAARCLCAWCGTDTTKDPVAMVEHQRTCEARNEGMEAQLRVTEADRDRLRTEVERLRGALAGLLELFRAPGEGYNDLFERVSDRFYEETGCLRPGKSVPSEGIAVIDDVSRQEKYDAWVRARTDAARAALEGKP